MPASEARTRANRENARRSTGPKTVEGKEKSRANSLKHGMTGAGIVLPEDDADEVERRAGEFLKETHATGEIGSALARLMALNSVRIERGADQQAAALSEHIGQVIADFVPPEGVDPAEANRLLAESVRRSMFDPSKEAALARRYGLAAERTFLRCLKELRQLGRAAQAEARSAPEAFDGEELGSFFPPELGEMDDAELDALYAELSIRHPRHPPQSLHTAAPQGKIDLPIAVGHRR